MAQKRTVRQSFLKVFRTEEFDLWVKTILFVSLIPIFLDLMRVGIYNSRPVKYGVGCDR
jgi:hypothetical protein